MEEDWEELQSPWRIEPVQLNDDHFPVSVPPPDSPPSSSASSSPTPPPESPPAAASTSERRLSSRAATAREIAARLRLRLWGIASKAAVAGRFWTVAGVVAAFVVSLLYRRMRSRWRRRSPPARMIRDDSKDRLAVLLREKDEKIGELMIRIAEMNEALSARRRVPVIRVGSG